jgi:hypothetical protein
MARQRKDSDLACSFGWWASLLATAMVSLPVLMLLVGLTPKLALSQVSTSPKIVASEIYQVLPNLPLENQYIRKETNKVAADSTLIERFIQYHTNVKGRSPGFRMDWKMSLADYLGVNDYLTEITYPGHAFLKTSPMKGDRAAIQALSRQQREALIQSLVDHYTLQLLAPNLKLPQLLSQRCQQRLSSNLSPVPVMPSSWHRHRYPNLMPFPVLAMLSY